MEKLCPGRLDEMGLLLFDAFEEGDDSSIPSNLSYSGRPGRLVVSTVGIGKLQHIDLDEMYRHTRWRPGSLGLEYAFDHAFR